MMKSNRLLRSIVLLLPLVAAPLCAQPPTTAATESVLIGRGDQIDLDVFSTPELSGELRVSDSGEIRLQTGTLVKIAGLSPFQAARAVEDSLVAAQMMNHPHVQVRIAKYATQTVSISGQVKTPGNYDLDTPRSVIDVLAMAGGLGELAERNITIERKSTHERIHYNVANNADRVLDQQVLVYPGDNILVPKVGVVYILGDVGHPGGYPMETNDSTITALAAIAMAGGVNTTAAASRSVLMHKTPQGYQESRLKLKDMEKGKEPNIQLTADDIIFVPFSYGRNLAVNGASIVAAAGQGAILHP